MPYDDLARMRAEMLMRQDPNMYDDGASQLGMNPYMQQVGLFGKGKPKPVAPVDVARRSVLGLQPQAPAQANLPAVRSSDVPVPNAVPQNVWAGGPFATNADYANVIKKHLEDRQAENAAQPQAPLESMVNKAANAPITRRELIKKAGQVVVNQALPMPNVAEAASPLAEAAKNVFVPNPTIDSYLQDYVSNMISEAAVNEPFAGISSAYGLMRGYLKGKVDEKTLKEMDSLRSDVDDAYDEDNIDDEAWEKQNKLNDFVHDKLKLLKPNELHDVNSNLWEEDTSPEELFNYIAETQGGQGFEDNSIVGKKAFVDYMNKASESKD